MNIASIDIGSNSVILLIAEINPAHKRFVTVLNRYATPRISKNLGSEMIFTPDSYLRLKEVLADFVSVAGKNNVRVILPAATQAFRKALNAGEIVNKVKEELGIEIRILSGHEEGLLTFYGAASNLENFSGYMIDIGGGSAEVFLGEPGNIRFAKSYNFGAVSICESFKSVPPAGKEKIDSIIQFVRNTISADSSLPVYPLPAVAVAGTPTTIACMQLGIKNFDENKIEGYELTLESIKSLSSELALMTPQEILSTYGEITEGREDVILTGGIILYTIMEMLNLESITVSNHGLRHGIIYNYLHHIIE